MNEPRRDVLPGLRQVVQQGVHHLVAQVGPRAERQLGGHARRQHGPQHGAQRQRGKIRRRAFGHNRLIGHGLPQVVGDAVIHQVERHALQRNGRAARGLAQADDRLRLGRSQRGQQRRRAVLPVNG